MSLRKRLLFSARDIGAGQAIAQIVLAARRSRKFDVTCALQAPAASRLGPLIGTFDRVEAPSVRGADDPSIAELLEAACRLLSVHKPDALIVGLSGPEAGIDEALLKMASDKIPTFAVQDFWGDINDLLGMLPRYTICNDEISAKLTRSTAQTEPIIVGSIKHAALASLDISRLRRDARSRFRLKQTERLVVVVGQPLWATKGYSELMRQIFDGLMSLMYPFRLVYRPHPKEAAIYYDLIKDIATAQNIEAFFDNGSSVLPILAAADVVITAFSTSGYDHAHLNRLSPVPLGTVIYALSEPGLAQAYRDTTGIDVVPDAEMGLALFAGSRKRLWEHMESATRGDVRETLWRRAHAKLNDPHNAPERALAEIEERLFQDTEIC